MNVTKRNGKTEPMAFDKITDRIKKLCYGLSDLLDPTKVALKVIEGIYDGISTHELDVLAGETCASMVTMHPDYARLGARIVVSNLHKSTKKSLYITMYDLHNYIDPKTGNNAPLISDETMAIVKKHRSRLESEIIMTNDFEYDYFGFKTLEKSYLLKINGEIAERPQHMIMRVSIGIHGNDIEEIIETYKLMSNRYFTHATPTLFNAGTPNPQMSSCFLLDLKEDSIDGIYDTLKQTALISKSAGGIGIAVHKARATGSYIRGTNGVSNGIVPMLQVFNATARYVDQGGGKRKGSFAMYIEPWHADIFDFLDLRKNHGKEEMRARDLFLGLWTNDLFMERVESNGVWSLMCPNECPNLHEVYGDDFKVLYERYEAEGKFIKQIKAHELWEKITESQIETGTPYMLFKDSANKKSNQKNLGTIKSSNLCVVPETQLLTDKGYIVIGDYEGKEVNVWNGKQFSKTTVVKTGENKSIIKVSLSDGKEIECTEYHKFYIQTGYKRGTGKNKLKIVEKRACELNKDDKLIKLITPLIEFEEDFKDAYTQGFFSGDGCSSGSNHISLYGGKIELHKHMSGSFYENTYNEKQDRRRFAVDNTYIKFEVPVNHTIKSRLDWLAGLSDSDGTLVINNTNQSLQIGSINKPFLDRIVLMLQTLGVQSKVTKFRDEGYRAMPDGKGGEKEYLCKDSYRLLVGSEGLFKLVELGFSPYRLKISNHKPNRNCEHFVKVLSVKDEGRESDTYCVNEPTEHKVVFNGIITGNCTEIIEYTSPDEVAVCNLASISLPMFVKDGAFDHELLFKVTKKVTRNLNSVIDRNFYPVQEAKNSNLRHRPIGLGVQGLADVFMLLKMPFVSPEAKQLNKEIFETIYFGAVTASNEIACVDGAYETYEGSPMSKGIFQHNMWGIDNDQLSGRWDWDGLREEVLLYGVRNSLLLAPMPTASTSQILGNNEAFEPYTSNMYTRRTISGEFIVVNKHLLNDLISLGMWNDDLREILMKSNGSVQNIEGFPDDLKEIYKTVWEMSMRDIIDMSRDRGYFIDQSQSLNLFMESATVSKLTSMHFYSWKQGLKTGMYYLRTKPAVDPIKFTLKNDKSKEVTILEEKPMSAEEFKAMIQRSREADPDDCQMCGS